MMIGGRLVARQQDKQQQQSSAIARKCNDTDTCRMNIDRPVERSDTSASRMVIRIDEVGRDSELQHQQTGAIQEEASSKHSGLSGQQSDDNSTGSWSANSLNCGAGGSSNGSRRTQAGNERRLSVILPQSQRSLLTPTIVTSDQGATPNQLFSSLIQLNGQEVGLFTGLPSCTPTSADGLARAGINPFFWGVQQQQQKSPNGNANATTLDLQYLAASNAANEQNGCLNNGCHASANYIASGEYQTGKPSARDVSAGAENKEQRRQLSKLSLDQLQAANAMILTSPLTSFLLSPENEAWLRLNLQSHPLAGKTGCCGQAEAAKQQPNYATDSEPAPASQEACGSLLDHSAESSRAQQANVHGQQQQPAGHWAAQDLTSNQMIATILNNTDNTQASPSQAKSAALFHRHHQPIAASPKQQNETNYNFMQQPAGQVGPAASSTNSSRAGQQQPSSLTRGAEIVQNPSQLVGRHQAQQASDPQAKSAASMELAYERGGHLEADGLARARAGQDCSMGPPAAHHQQLQLQLQLPQHHQASLLVMGAHPLEPRLVEFQHHHHQTHPLNGLDYDGAKSVGLYEPHFQQFFLAQKHQQEVYSQQHSQQQYTNYQHQQPQQTVASYHLAPSEQSQQLPVRQQPQPTARYRDRLGPEGGAQTVGNATAEDPNLANNNSAHHTDTSSSSNSLSSAKVSPRCHHFSSSARSSVSRDTNSIDVIATNGLKAMGADEAPAAKSGKQQQAQKESQGSKQSANSRRATKKTADKLEPVISGDDQQPPVAKKKSKGGRKKKIVTSEELLARKNRSKERNRVAAKRCRQKRKQFLDELRGRIDNLSDLNKKLLKENSQLKGELDQLRKHHKVCVAI